jgi:hypothetical protein
MAFLGGNTFLSSSVVSSPTWDQCYKTFFSLVLLINQKKLVRLSLSIIIYYCNTLSLRLEPSSVIYIIIGQAYISLDKPGKTKGGRVTVPLTSCLTGLDSVV